MISNSLLETKISVSLAVILALILCVRVLNSLSADTQFFAQDQATDFIVAGLMEQGEYALLGPPSHVGGRHPGPLYYWYVYAVSKMSGFDPFMANIFFSISKLLGLIIIAFLTAAMLPASVRWWGVCGIMLCAHSPHFLKIFTMQWQSHFLFVSASFAWGCFYLLLRFGALLIALFALGLSVLLQSHLGSVPVVSALLLTGLIVVAQGNRSFVNIRARSSKLPAYVKGLIIGLPVSALIVLWYPVLKYELSYSSNLSRLFSVHSGNAVTSPAGVLSALQTAGYFFAHKAFSGTILTVYPWWGVAAFCVCLAFINLSWLKEAQALQRMLFAAMLLSLILSVVALSLFRPPLYEHYLYTSVPLTLILTGCLFGWAVRRIIIPSGIKAASISTVFLGLYLFSLSHLLSQDNKPEHPAYHTLTHARDVSTLLSAGGYTAAWIETAYGSKVMKNSYAYFLNHKRLGNLEYARFFSELPSFQSLPDTAADGFMIVCPKPFSAGRREISDKLSVRWGNIHPVNTPTCMGCETCELWLLSGQTPLEMEMAVGTDGTL